MQGGPLSVTAASALRIFLFPRIAQNTFLDSSVFYTQLATTDSIHPQTGWGGQDNRVSGKYHAKNLNLLKFISCPAENWTIQPRRTWEYLPKRFVSLIGTGPSRSAEDGCDGNQDNTFLEQLAVGNEDRGFLFPSTQPTWSIWSKELNSIE